MHDLKSVEAAMESLGYIYPNRIGGIQTNLSKYCDNRRCCEGYECETAPLAEPGMWIDKDDLVQATINAKEALRISRERLVGDCYETSTLTKFLMANKLPEVYRRAIYNAYVKSLKAGQLDNNFIGGEPSKHPYCMEIGEEIRKDPHVSTSLTTNGIRLMNDYDFYNEVTTKPAFNVVALSVDSSVVPSIYKLSSSELEAKYDELLKTNASGQLLKTVAGLSVLARIYEDGRNKKVGTLINMVVSPENLGAAREIRSCIQERFPDTKQNPYSGQVSFYHRPLKFSENDIPAYREYALNMLEDQRKPNTDIKRPYWAEQKTILDTWTGGNLLRGISGYAWSCHNAGGAYINLGPTPDILLKPGDKIEPYIECLWSPAITSMKPANHMTAVEIADYMKNLPNIWCRCGMPRLEDDIARYLMGLDEELIPAFVGETQKQVDLWIAQSAAQAAA